MERPAHTAPFQPIWNHPAEENGQNVNLGSWGELILRSAFAFATFGCCHNSCAGELPRSASSHFLYDSDNMNVNGDMMTMMLNMVTVTVFKPVDRDKFLKEINLLDISYKIGGSIIKVNGGSCTCVFAYFLYAGLFTIKLTMGKRFQSNIVDVNMQIPRKSVIFGNLGSFKVHINSFVFVLHLLADLVFETNTAAAN